MNTTTALDMRNPGRGAFRPGGAERGSQNAMVPCDDPDEFRMRNNALCVVRGSDRGMMYAESGVRRKAVLMLPDGKVFDIFDDQNNSKGGLLMNQTAQTQTAVKKIGKPAVVPGSGVVDSNRFYTTLLDARTANITVSENMHDIADKLLKGEKDNAKLALDQLWTLKKTLVDDGTDGTVDTLITYYQDKIDVLREKEENIKKVGRNTRELIEEKRKKDEELLIVKAQIGSSARELKDLNAKIQSLRKREVELTAAEKQLREEICANETRIVSGLYDIILHRPESAGGRREDDDAIDVIRQAAAQIQKTAEAASDDYFNEDVLPPSNERGRGADVINKEDDDDSTVAIPQRSLKEEEPAHDPIVYPKSVVRMGGKIIGEYYHDGNVVTKEECHYIYNSRFMADRVSAGIGILKNRFSQDTHAELIKIAEDAASRVRENGRFHFEVSTNEILNDKNLKQLVADLRRRVWDDAERFAVRLGAKIEALGSNYGAMLQEQMERCSEIG